MVTWSWTFDRNPFVRTSNLNHVKVLIGLMSKHAELIALNPTATVIKLVRLTSEAGCCT